MLLRLTVGLLAVLGAILFAVDNDGLTRADLAVLREERQRTVQLPPVRSAPPSEAADAAARADPAPGADAGDALADGDDSAAQGAAPAEAAEQADQDNAAPPAAAAEPEAAPVMLVVTGSRVNVRAGPSTSDEVVTQVLEGDRVELVDRREDGWVRIRVRGVAADVYMSSDFLSETQ